MRAEDFHDFHGPITWHNPIDDLEPEIAPFDQVRDARMTAVNLLNDFATKIYLSLTGTSDSNALVTLFGISYGMGLNICGGMTMTERAEQLGVERATLSKIAVAWNLSHDLQPSFHQKSEEANANYAHARRELVKRNGHLPKVPRKHRSV